MQDLEPGWDYRYVQVSVEENTLKPTGHFDDRSKLTELPRSYAEQGWELVATVHVARKSFQPYLILRRPSMKK